MATQPPSPTTPLDRNAPPHTEPFALPETRSRAAASTDRLPNINTEDEIKTLEMFLNVNMGTQEYRDYKRKVSYYRLWTQLAITVLLQSCLCFAFLAFFVWVRPAQNRKKNDTFFFKPITGDRWPNIQGVSVVLTVIGTATTFLLVFSLSSVWKSTVLSWTFSRWREARDLMETTFVTLRDLYIYIATSLPDGEADTLRTALLWFGAVLVICMDYQSAKEDRIRFLPKRLRLHYVIAKRLARAFTERVDKHKWRAHLDEDKLQAMKLAKVSGTRFDKQPEGYQSARARRLNDKKNKVAFLKNEVLKAHVQIRKEIVALANANANNEVFSNAVDVPGAANSMCSTLLQNFYAMDKFKNVEMPGLIKRLLFLLTSVYTWIIFPILMPYVFVMSLDQHAIKTHLLLTDRWPTAVFVPVFICVEINQCVGCWPRRAVFIVSTSIVLFYFNLLYCIQAELEDPFGDDYSDLKLRKLFLAPLTKDFQDISLALKASESQDGDEASNIFVKLVKDMSVMQFDDRASFRVVARSVDGDGEEGDPK